jgi:S-DNA-T family DNA segregation ATPase FtsK/SpoIIIE
MSWLPHIAVRLRRGRPVTSDPAAVRIRTAELAAQLDQRAREHRGEHLSRPGRCTVVVLDGACALRTVPGVARILAQGPSLGMHALCLDRDPVALPGECGAIVELSGSGGGRATLTVRDAAAVSDVVVDLPTQAWAHRLGRALAPLRDATPSARREALPEHARLLEVLPVDATDPATIAAGWRTCARSTRAVVGLGSEGAPVAVDLARDGPHALVAGTTGAGKSELLQTLVASLALVNRPDEMVFVLIDYKGGSAFADCARLPHTVGMVTDLDPHLTERALTSLGAELRRRKAVLARAGCKDVEDYLHSGHHQDQPLPRLVLVIDEFAALVEELPAFMGGLVSIAQLGRSLGVHLVLATQRPAGVVNADIKANTNLRIALRVTDPGESMDVIEARDAALIGPGTPGRAYARVGTADLVAFQSARVGGRDVAGPPAEAQVIVLASGREPPEPPADPLARFEAPPHKLARDQGPTDLARLVDACVQAARDLDLTPVPSPWLAPVPDVVILADLPSAPPWLVPLGLRDLPAEQSRAPWGLDLEHGGHLMVAGGPRSGRTTVLRTLAGSVGTRYGVQDVHLFGVDGAGGELLSLAGLPHTGTVVTREELTRADRLLTRLLSEVRRRQELFGRRGVASIAEHRALTESAPSLPYLVLLLDSWEGLAQAFEVIDHGRPVDTMLRLVREGSSAGLRVVVTGDRTLLGSRVSSLIADRLLLPLADRGDYALAGVAARLVPDRLPPGRGLLPERVVETQVALLSPDPTGQAQVAALTAIAERARTRAASVSPERRPLHVHALPATVAASALATAARRAATGPLWALVGVGGDAGDCLGVDLAADGPAFLVAGPAGSGRSTTLLTMGRSLLARGCSIVVLAPRRSPVRDLRGEPGVLGTFGAADRANVREALASPADPLVVLVDDAESLNTGDAGDELLALLRGGGEPGRALVLAGCCTGLAQQFRGLGAEARKNRLGLVLAPGGGIDSDLLGIRVPRGDGDRPGRGVLVRRGTLADVQVALPG